MNLELTAIEQIIVRQALERFQEITAASLPTSDNKETTNLMLETIENLIYLIKRTKE
jgi:hypothetical protein